MYKILHTYFHAQGHALARHMSTYQYRQSLHECWEVQGATPVMEVFTNEDRSYSEIFWIWESQDKYQHWMARTPLWDFFQLAGYRNCITQNVLQIHCVPEVEDTIHPLPGLELIDFFQLMSEYNNND